MKALVQRAMGVAGVPLARLLRPVGIHPPVSRDAFRAMIPQDVLELGPFDTPFVPDAFYFDILDQDQLRVRATEHGRNPDGVPKIHYTGRLSTIERTFDAVVSSHVVEHTPDLIGHLEEVASLLRPGGAYLLIVPDKRYCCDHFLTETTQAEVFNGRGREKPAIDAVVDHLTRTAHNSALKHWVGIHGEPSEQPRARYEIQAAERGEYVDVHQWIFTPSSFKAIIESVGVFPKVQVFDTAWADFEFMAVLSGK